MIFLKDFASEIIILKCTRKLFVTIFISLFVILPLDANRGLRNATLLPSVKSFMMTSLNPASSPFTTTAYPSLVYAKAARNLSAQPKPSKHRQGDLQLNVSWVPPNDTDVADYTLEVQALSKTPDCITKLCYEYNINKNFTWTMIPSDVSTIEGDSCSISPGCSYIVSLISHPWNGSERTTINVTIPECVNGSCSCAHATMLPIPIVKATLLPTFEIPHETSALSQLNTSFLDASTISSDSTSIYVNISWIMPLPTSPRRLPKTLQFDYFLVSLGRQKVVRHRKPWYGHDLVWRVSGERRWCVVKANLTASQSHLARVWVQDSRGCMGQVGNYTIPGADKLKQNISPWQILRPEVLVLSCALIAAIAALALRRAGACVAAKVALDKLCRNKQRAPSINLQTDWPFSQDRPRVCGSVRRVEERNQCYVEKEIEDKNDPWEVSQWQFKIGKEIGSGAFGVVYKAKLDLVGRNRPIIVALKMLKNHVSSDDTSEFLREIDMLKKADSHPHVVRLIGCCTIRPPYIAFLEYAPRGSLLNLLHDTRNRWIMSNMVHRPSSKGRFLHLVKLASSLSSSYIQPSNYVEKIQEVVEKESDVRPSVTDTEYTVLSTEGLEESQRPSSHLYVLDPGIRAPVATSDTNESDECSHESDPFDLDASDAEDTADCLQTSMILDPTELHSFALQIAKGMAHLEKRDITHRDLAARNVLVDANGILKISDFGLSRTGVYEVQHSRKVPFRWLALEAIKRNVYSSKSDVWAYGIVLFEIGTLGGLPYHPLENSDVIPFLESGQRLSKPDSITNNLYELMLKCWKHFPQERPSFLDIVGLLEMAGNRTYVDFDTLKDYVFPPTEAELNEVIDNSKIESDSYVETNFKVFDISETEKQKKTKSFRTSSSSVT